MPLGPVCREWSWGHQRWQQNLSQTSYSCFWGLMGPTSHTGTRVFHWLLGDCCSRLFHLMLCCSQCLTSREGQDIKSSMGASKSSSEACRPFAFVTGSWRDFKHSHPTSWRFCFWLGPDITTRTSFLTVFQHISCWSWKNI